MAVRDSSDPEPEPAAVVDIPLEDPQLPVPRRTHSDFLTTACTAREKITATVRFRQYIRDLDDQSAFGAPILATTTSHNLKAIGPLLLYSDGSLTGAGTSTSSMAFGIASLDPTAPEISGRAQGFSSSTAAELMGLFGAIMAANPSHYLIVSLDNLSVVDNFTKLVNKRDSQSLREKSRCNHALQWASIARACKDRLGSTTVNWIKGHNNDVGNDKADQIATNAQLEQTPRWSIGILSIYRITSNTNMRISQE
ncbi:hypothetical protein BGX27_004344 [Mortierella sp. AM989]|nr:hypothetical protein BGX27_004344 [Mortierella sp. AM989]